MIRSAAAHDGVLDDADRGRVVEYVARHLPGLVPEPYAPLLGELVLDLVEGGSAVPREFRPSRAA